MQEYACKIDWGLLADWVVALAAASAAVIGSFGFHTWKKQLKVSTEYESAKSAMTALHYFGMVIRRLRDPLIDISFITAEGFVCSEEDAREAELAINTVKSDISDRLEEYKAARKDLDLAIVELRYASDGHLLTKHKNLIDLSAEVFARLWYAKQQLQKKQYKFYLRDGIAESNKPFHRSIYIDSEKEAASGFEKSWEAAFSNLENSIKDKLIKS